MSRPYKQRSKSSVPRRVQKALITRITCGDALCWLRHRVAHQEVQHMLDEFGLLLPSYRGVYSGVLRRRKAEIDGEQPGSLKHRLYRRLVDHAKKHRTRREVACWQAVPDADFSLDGRCKAQFGFTLVEFIDHVERLFTAGMTWDRVLKGDVQIDHEVPVRVFDLNSQRGFQAAYALSNTQPLWRGDNARKGKTTDLDWIELFGEGVIRG